LLQINKASSVYQKQAHDRASSNQDEVNWIDIILFQIIPVSFFCFTKDLPAPGVDWQHVLYTIGVILSLIISYLAMTLLRILWGLVLLGFIGIAVLAIGYELVVYIL